MYAGRVGEPAWWQKDLHADTGGNISRKHFLRYPTKYNKCACGEYKNKTAYRCGKCRDREAAEKVDAKRCIACGGPRGRNATKWCVSCWRMRRNTNARLQRHCQLCDKPKGYGSTTCWDCYLKWRKLKTKEMQTCPDCQGTKHYLSIRCQACHLKWEAEYAKKKYVCIACGGPRKRRSLKYCGDCWIKERKHRTAVRFANRHRVDIHHPHKKARRRKAWTSSSSSSSSSRSS